MEENMFASIDGWSRRNRREAFNEALIEVRKGIEEVADVYEVLRARATEHGLIPGDVELDAKDFLDEDTVSLLKDLESAHGKIVARMRKLQQPAIPFEIDSLM
jgi:hypothetical protein